MELALDLKEFSNLHITESDGAYWGIITHDKGIAYEFDKVCDFREYDALAFDVYVPEGVPVSIRAAVYPLKIARPEFIELTEARITVAGKGWIHVELGFELFDYNKMVGAFWKYISAVKIEADRLGIAVRDIKLKKRGVIHISAKQYSLVRDPGETAEYTATVGNLTGEPVAVTLIHNKYAYESMRLEIVPPEIKLNAGESADIKIIAHIHDNIAPGGFEKHLIIAVPNGDSNHQKPLELITVRRLPHPFLIHTETGWDGVRKKIEEYTWASNALREHYIEPAEKWVVPESAGGTYVFPAYSQKDLRAAAIAWKLTGRRDFGEKSALYLRRLVSPVNGYMTTATPYFVFIESYDEYAKGNPKEHRACSAGWVQEAEFFIQAAVSYDLLHDTDLLTEEDHKNIEYAFRSFIKFMDWLLTDGDGNNFQLAEATAGLYCAMAIQDYHWINRFLYGCNGLADLTSAVIMDDGIYFELATSYMGLGMSLMLEAAIACENWGINYKSACFPAAYDRNILHSPWSMKEKPFLGMSFERYGKNRVNHRSLEQYLDAFLRLLDHEGRMFSCNDGREMAFHSHYEIAYFLYRKPKYAAVIKTGQKRKLLYGVPELPEIPADLFEKSSFSENAGLAVLRSQNDTIPAEKRIQAVLKYGTHGGYHGHFDRISLLSVIRNGESFFNCLHAWYGYDSFLFKMWVQTSLAHNMVVVDQKMQRPSQCEMVLFHSGRLFQACAAETEAQWSDVPYGGQTPYPLSFPDEKCAKEKRYVLPAPYKRAQGDIGEYTEPVFQRRLIIVTDEYVLSVDYLKSSEAHTFDCLYHPEGIYDFAGKAPVLSGYTDRLDDNPFGAGQFINNCYHYEVTAPLKIMFTNNHENETHSGAMRGMSHVNIYAAYPDTCGLIIAKYPDSSDTFKPEDIAINKEINKTGKRKTIALRQQGNEARFITALEPYIDESIIESIECVDFGDIVVTLKGNTVHRIRLTDADSRQKPSVELTVLENGIAVRSERTNNY